MNKLLILKAIDDHIVELNKLDYQPNAVLLGRDEWALFATALDSLGIDIPPGTVPNYHGLCVYPVNLPSLLTAANTISHG